ncbi:hypothetical protein, partial [Laribacter hongkongensis]|uniref:hypothetical protein n=2 Tax=Laribacter hongkongensis TaxID=168471 RepID=UPI001EFEAC3B
MNPIMGMTIIEVSINKGSLHHHGIPAPCVSLKGQPKGPERFHLLSGFTFPVLAVRSTRLFLLPPASKTRSHPRLHPSCFFFYYPDLPILFQKSPPFV